MLMDLPGGVEFSDSRRIMGKMRMKLSMIPTILEVFLLGVGYSVGCDNFGHKKRTQRCSLSP